MGGSLAKKTWFQKEWVESLSNSLGTTVNAQLCLWRYVGRVNSCPLFLFGSTILEGYCNICLATSLVLMLLLVNIVEAQKFGKYCSCSIRFFTSLVSLCWYCSLSFYYSLLCLMHALESIERHCHQPKLFPLSYFHIRYYDGSFSSMMWIVMMMMTCCL